MRWAALALMLLLALLQYRLWLAEGSLAELHRLDAQLLKQQALNQGLRSRNRQLELEVLELQQGLETVEDRARQDLGMIREGEIYYQVVEKTASPDPAEAASSDEQ
jgi:cell division protein FtsB